MLRAGASTWERVLSIALGIAILGALGMLGYVIARPQVGERFTEFYILGLEGRAERYPTQLMVGEEGKVRVGIINREHETASYWVEVRMNGVKNDEIGPVVLGNDEKWEGEASFAPQLPGENQKVEFFLYKDGAPKPYMEPLHLLVDVME